MSKPQNSKMRKLINGCLALRTRNDGLKIFCCIQPFASCCLCTCTCRLMNGHVQCDDSHPLYQPCALSSLLCLHTSTPNHSSAWAPWGESSLIACSSLTLYIGPWGARCVGISLPPQAKPVVLANSSSASREIRCTSH